MAVSDGTMRQETAQAADDILEDSRRVPQRQHSLTTTHLYALLQTPTRLHVRGLN